MKTVARGVLLLAAILAGFVFWVVTFNIFYNFGGIERTTDNPVYRVLFSHAAGLVALVINGCLLAKEFVMASTKVRVAVNGIALVAFLGLLAYVNSLIAGTLSGFDMTPIAKQSGV